MEKLPYNVQKWDYVKNELLKIDALLEKNVDIYLIGGSAMSYYGIKDATKDIDVLFKNQYDCADFFNAITELEYETSEQYFPPVIQMEATFFVYKDDEIWIDHWRPKVENQYSGNALYLQSSGKPFTIRYLGNKLSKHGKQVWKYFQPYDIRHWCAVARLTKTKKETGKFDAYTVKN